jgi:hypothetical protein
MLAYIVPMAMGEQGYIAAITVMVLDRKIQNK